MPLASEKERDTIESENNSRERAQQFVRKTEQLRERDREKPDPERETPIEQAYDFREKIRSSRSSTAGT